MKRIGSVLLVVALLLGEILGGKGLVAYAASQIEDFGTSGWNRGDGEDVIANPEGSYSNGNWDLTFYSGGSKLTSGPLYEPDGYGEYGVWLKGSSEGTTDEVRIRNTSNFDFNGFKVISWFDQSASPALVDCKVSAYDSSGNQVGTTVQCYIDRSDSIVEQEFNSFSSFVGVREVRIKINDAEKANVVLTEFTADVQTNIAPTIANFSSGTATYTEDGSSVKISSGGNATVIDGDSADFNGGSLTVSISGNNVPAEDVLGIQSGSGITLSGANVIYGGNTIGTYTGGTSGNALNVALTSNATPTSVSALINQITYANTNGGNPSMSIRTLTTTLTDGDGGSTSVTSTVNVVGVNDTPIIDITNPTANQVVNATGTITLSGTVSDSDKTTNTVTATLAGVTKSISVNTGGSTNWSLTWNVSTDSIPEGSYTNFAVVASDSSSAIDTKYYTGTITVDKTAPTSASISINNGDTYATNRMVTLSPGAVDATQMIISENSSFTGASYEAYNASKSYTFSSDGAKTLYVKYKDAAGNETNYVTESITVDTQAPTGGSISINAGAAYTNNANVTLTLSATDASEMMISDNISFTGATYEAYATLKSITLSAGDDTKTIYVKFKDAAGNVTTAINDSIVLATHAPTGGTVSINSGATATNSASVTLTLYADNATSMMISEDSGFGGASYETYATSKSFTLTSGDGTKTVYVKYKDIAGNETTTTISDSITLDTTAPSTAPVVINGGATYTNNQVVSLTIPVISDADQMMISESSSFVGASYQAYTGTASYNLSAGDGTKSLYIKFKDAVGNVSATSSATSIILDTQAPTGGSISINSGAAYTNNANVTLTLSASGATQMIISEDSSFTGATYEAYSTSKSLTLSSGDDTKTVYVKFKDAAGNETTSASDSIILATHAPTGGTVSINSGAVATNSTSVSLSLFADNATSMMISEDNGFVGASYESYATSKSFTISSGDGVKTIYVKYKDIAGNETSTAISDSIMLDTTAPSTASLTINGGAAYTNNQAVSLTIPTITDADQMMISESSIFSGASYQAYAGTATYNLSAGDGTKSLYIKFKDAAGNVSATSSATSIVLDTQAPTANSININLGTSYTNSTTVLLTLASTGADYMMISEDSSFTGASYVAYTTTKNFTLSSTNGTKTIYVKYKDLAGNVSSAVSHTIQLDTEGPTSGSVIINVGDTVTNNSSVTLTLSATDASQMMISSDSSFTGATYEAYATSKTISLSSTDGSKTIYVKYKDNHGNESAVVSDSIFLDSNFHGVTVTPGTVSVQKGNMLTFSSLVASAYGYSQDVTWSVSGNSSTGTSISSTGVLSVALDESATSLLVKATSTSSATVYGTATVSVTAVPVVTYTVSASPDPLVGGSVSGAGTITSGGSVTLTATANSGYTFKNWKENGTIVSTSAIYTIPSITADHTYVATFESETALGDITKKVETAKNVPETTVDMDKADLIKAVFTEEEQLQIQNGVNAEILFQVDNIDGSVSKSDKKLIETGANGYQAGQYLDISVWKQLGSADKTRLTSLNAPVQFKISIPSKLLNHDSSITRSFAVIRLHDETPAILQDLDSDSTTLTISTPLFSTYAIVYKDTAKDTSGTSGSSSSNNQSSTTTKSDLDSVPDTGESSPIVWLFLLIGISGVGIFALSHKKKREVRR